MAEALATIGFPFGAVEMTGPGRPYTCSHCGCLCDDLELVVAEERVVEAVNACALARPRLLGMATAAEAPPSARVRGVVAGYEEAAAEAARLLLGARGVVMLGFARSTNETVREAVALADRLGATLAVGDEASAWPRLAALQRVGSVGATLGEVKNRADVVVYWAVDPVVSHPRHLERYSAEAAGRFLPEGRVGRRLVVLDSTRTATAGRADVFLQVDPKAELNVLLALRALVREAPLDRRRVEAATGLPLAQLQDLAETLRGSTYGAWFVGAFAGRGPVAEAEARRQALTWLIRDLNRSTRFVACGLGEAGNAHGAESVIGWQSGFAPGVDFGAGFPESWPGESSAAARLARGAFDVAVVVGGEGFDALSEALRERLAAKPWIFVGEPVHEAFGRATIALPSAAPGVDESGTYTRVDGVTLPVRAVRPASSPGAGAWLRRIGEDLAGVAPPVGPDAGAGA